MAHIVGDERVSYRKGRPRFDPGRHNRPVMSWGFAGFAFVVTCVGIFLLAVVRGLVVLVLIAVGLVRRWFWLRAMRREVAKILAAQRPGTRL